MKRYMKRWDVLRQRNYYYYAQEISAYVSLRFYNILILLNIICYCSRKYFTLRVLHKAVNSVVIFGLVSNLTNIIVIDESHSNANENFKRSL